jgi:anti-sigma B factor antagonist
VPGMQVLERRIGDVTLLTLAGRLVLGEGDVALRERIDALIQEGRVKVVVNMHEVTYIDSCGIGGLVSKYLSLHNRGGNLKLVCPSERCRRVLALTHLLPILQTFESEDVAIRSFAALSAH